MDVARLFFGRSFSSSPQHDFGAGLGLHNLDLSAFIEGEAILDGGASGVQRIEVGGSQILPNLSAWYQYSPSRDWLINARIDWISAKVGKIDGTLWNTTVGVAYQFSRHVGVSLGYQYFNLKATVDNSNWEGGADMRYSGPLLAVTGNW
jgi:hypothetical protein